MSGFPLSSTLPRINGDTDDDASIHLHTTIGPAKPLAGKKYVRTDVDERIYHELRDVVEDNDEIDEEDEEEEEDRHESISHHDLNDSFRKYQQQLVYNEFESDDEEDDMDYNEDEEEAVDDDTTEVESELDQSEHGSESDDDKELQALNERVRSFNEAKYTQLRSPVQTLPSSDKPNQSLFEEFRSTSENRNVDTILHDKETHGDDEDNNEKDNDVNEGDHPATSTTNTSKNSTKRDVNFLGLFGFVLLMFTVVLGVHLIIYVQKFTIGNFQPSSSSGGSTSRYSHTIGELKEITDKLNKRQEFLEHNQFSSLSSINSKFDLINSKFETIESTVRDNLHKFQQEISLLQSIQGSKSGNNNETLIHENISSIKQDIINEFVNQLPQYIPVYIKNDKIHFVPQFHKYLYNFIENYHQSHPSIQTTNTTTVHLPTNNTNKNFIDKQELEKYLEKKFLNNNKFIINKFNNLIDSLNLSASNITTTTHETTNKLIKATNKILLNQLLKLVSNGSIKINYSDYTLGARILGFLTKSNFKNRSPISHKLFLGWYDYVSGSSGKNLGYNANSVILDTDQSWNCQSSTSSPCSIGIRLSDSIVISDLILSVNPGFEGVVSIWIKPNQKGQSEKLLKYLNGLKITEEDIVSTRSKYLNRFFKIKQFKPTKSQTESDSRLMHVKFPTSLISLGIATKDIYFEFRSTNAIQINNIKTYGLSELNTQKYDKQFQLILDKIDNEDNIELFEEEEEGLQEDASPYIQTYELLDDDEFI